MEETTNIIEVTGTPFSLVIKTTDEKKSVKIICGQYLMTTKVFKSEEYARNYINKKAWELIANLCIVLNKEMNNINLKEGGINE